MALMEDLGHTGANGRTLEGWTEFDHIIGRFLVEQRIPGASVAVSQNGKILYQQGYGVAGGSKRVQPDSLFRIASISKPVTAAITLKQCEKQKVSLDANVFGKNGILKWYRTRDKRMKNITIRHLLQHSAGWDRDKVGDAVFVKPQCVMKEHPDSEAFNTALLSYALNRKLQFAPGTWHSYSNLGYLVLGKVIEALSGQCFERVMNDFLHELNISNVRVGMKMRARWESKEVEYFNNREPQVVDSIYPHEGLVLPQYGGFAMESSGSYGGLVADTESLLKFVHSMELAVQRAAKGDRDDVEKHCDGSESSDNVDVEVVKMDMSQNNRSGSCSRQTAVKEVSKDCYESNNDKEDCDVKSNMNKDILGAAVRKTDISEDCGWTACSGEDDDKNGDSDGLDSIEEWDDTDVKYTSGKACAFRHRGDNDGNDICKDIKMEIDSPELSLRILPNTSARGQHIINKDASAAYNHQLNGIYTGTVPSDLATSSICSYHHNSEKTPASFARIPTSSTNGSSVSSLKNTDNLPQNFEHSCHQCCLVNSSRQFLNSGSSFHCPGQFSEQSQIPSVQPGLQGGTSEYLIKRTHPSHAYCTSFNENSTEELTDAQTMCDSNELYENCLEAPPCPLLTVSQTKESLAIPRYENGQDWYGLGWDVQDNGKSWGHTGGMEGSCGTLFHHKSGLNWAFLLNSWAVDCDLNGVIKCALCSVPQMKMYDREVLSFEGQHGVRITTLDKSQITLLGADQNTVSRVISDVKPQGYFVTWISTMQQNVSCVVQGLLSKSTNNCDTIEVLPEQMKSENLETKYIVIFHKSQVKEYSIVFDKTVEELKIIIDRYAVDKYHISFLDSYANPLSQLKYTAVFEYDDTINPNDTTTHLAVQATDYVKMARLFVSKQHILVQSVTEVSNELYVSVILSAKVKNKSNENVLPDTTITLSNTAITTSDLSQDGSLHAVVTNACSDVDLDTWTLTEPDLNLKSPKTDLGRMHTEDTSQVLSDSPTTSANTSNDSADSVCLMLNPASDFDQTLSSCSMKGATKSRRTKRSKSQTAAKSNSIYWVQITPESFLTELNRQVKQRNGLVYAKFYTADKKPYVSSCWFPKTGGNCYQRTSLSKYGLVPELVEAASLNVRLQCLSEYEEEDGMMYYAALWYAN